MVLSFQPNETFLRMKSVLMVIMALGLASAMAAERPRLNILFILADDLGAHDVGCFGSRYYETPHIDSLARRGVKMTRAYAASPLCSPTRSSILAGVYPARTGITSPSCHVPQIQLEKKLAAGNANVKALNADSVTRLKPEYFTLAEAFHEEGYATAHFGKWHLGYNLPQNKDDHYEPKDQGFDFDFPHTPNAPGPGGGYLAPWKFIKDPAIHDEAGKHIEDRMSEEAAKYIMEHRDQPFFLNYWAFSVHSPWNARKDYIEHFKSTADPANPQHNPLYAAMVRSLDDGVGRLLRAVDEAGIADRTIIVFFSDNGGYSYPPKTTDPEGYENIAATSNLPQRSGKASLYDGGTREPCIVVWPGKVKPATVNEALFQSTDFYPTLLAICGIKPHKDVKLDGFDQSAALLGKASPRDRLFCHFPHGTPNQAENIPGMLPGTYVQKGDWKLIRFFVDNDDGSDRLELYNLKDDPGENNDLAKTKPEIVQELNPLISVFLKDTDAVIPIRNPGWGAQPKVAYDPLQGWKARSCDAVVKDGIVTLTGKGGQPFLGMSIGKQSGPATAKIRVRCANSGEGHLEWIQPDSKIPNKDVVSFKITGGDWQEVTATVPEKGPLGILRVYLPAQKQPVSIDWIDVEAGKSPKHWDF